MKLNLAKLKNNVSETSESATSLNLANLKTTQNSVEEDNTPSFLNFGNVSSSSSESTPEELAREDGFTLSFTDGEEYNLDDIVFAKRRDNSECPLIVKVNMADEYDTKILETITKLILDDYGISYTDDNYEEQVYKVESFYTVFDYYFNKYYTIYYNQYKEVRNGSISLNTVIDDIKSYHDDNYTNIYGETLNTYNTTDVFNKPRVEYEDGNGLMMATGVTLYDTETSVDLSLLSLDVENGKLKLKYDGEAISDGLELKTFDGETVFGHGEIMSSTAKDVVLREDIGNCEFTSATSTVLVDDDNKKGLHEADCQITVSDFTFEDENSED